LYTQNIAAIHCSHPFVTFFVSLFLKLVLLMITVVEIVMLHFHNHSF